MSPDRDPTAQRVYVSLHTGTTVSLENECDFRGYERAVVSFDLRKWKVIGPLRVERIVSFPGHSTIRAWALSSEDQGIFYSEPLFDEIHSFDSVQVKLFVNIEIPLKVVSKE